MSFPEETVLAGNSRGTVSGWQGPSLMQQQTAIPADNQILPPHKYNDFGFGQYGGHREQASTPGSQQLGFDGILGQEVKRELSSYSTVRSPRIDRQSTRYTLQPIQNFTNAFGSQLETDGSISTGQVQYTSAAFPFRSLAAGGTPSSHISSAVGVSDQAPIVQGQAPAVQAMVHSFSGIRQTLQAPSSLGPAAVTTNATSNIPVFQTAATLAGPADQPKKIKTAIGAQRISSRNIDHPSGIQVTAGLPACQIGAVELLAFFPFHTEWPKVLLRLLGNGWTSNTLAQASLHARDTLSVATCTRRDGAIRQQVSVNANAEFNLTDFTRGNYPNLIQPVGTYDATAYTPRAWRANRIVTAKLVDIDQGVVNWPAPEDAGIVTQVIQLAVDGAFTELTTSDIPQIAQFFGFQMPADAATPQWDQRGLRRVLAAITAAGTYV